MRLRAAVENRMEVKPGEIKFTPGLQRAVFNGMYALGHDIKYIKATPNSKSSLADRGYAQQVTIGRKTSGPERRGSTAFATYHSPSPETLSLISVHKKDIVLRANRVEVVANKIKKVAVASLVALSLPAIYALGGFNSNSDEHNHTAQPESYSSVPKLISHANTGVDALVYPLSSANATQ